MLKTTQSLWKSVTLIVIPVVALVLCACQTLYPRGSGTFGKYDTGDEPFETLVNVPRAGANLTLDYTVQVEEGAFTIQVISPEEETIWEKTHQAGTDTREIHTITAHSSGVCVVRITMRGFTGKYSLGLQGPSALNWALVVEILVDVGAAFVIAWAVRRRWGGPWRAFWIGALFFGLCQLGELPLAIGIGVLGQFITWPNWLGGLVAGLIAGVFEETARYLGMRFTGTMRRNRTWSAGVLYGAGHGGLENAIVGAGVALLALLAFLPPAYLPETVQPFLAARPWYDHLCGGLGRVMTLALHIGLTLLVLQVFTRRKLRYLWIAMAWHAWIDFTIVGLGLEFENEWLSVALLALYTLISLGIIAYYRLEMSRQASGEDGLQISPEPIERD